MINNKILFHADDFGRSSEISKNILKCLEYGSLNSVSVMVHHDQDSLYKLKELKGINIRLHLNLTEIPKTNEINSDFLSNLNFFKLLFLNKRKKKIIFDEIDNQIIKFIKIFQPKSLKIDGHEHVHFIPWIYNHISKNINKFNISEIRNSNEKLMMPRFKDVFSITYLRNLSACMLIKFFSLVNKKLKISSIQFSGLLYSGIQDEQTLLKTIKYFKRKNIKIFEILIHPGFASKDEKKKFKNEYFSFYNSQKRIIEYDLCFSGKIKKELRSI